MIQESKSIEVLLFICSWFHVLSGYPSGVYPSKPIHIPEIRPDAKVPSAWLEESLAKHQVVGREETGKEHRLVQSSHMESRLILGSWKINVAHKMPTTGQ